MILNRDTKGFTIIELMVALSIFSVILVISTTLIIQINKTFTKGVNAAGLQNANRNLVADITSSIQFSGKIPSITGCDQKACWTKKVGSGPTAKYALCLGTTRFTFRLDSQQGNDPLPQHIFWRDTLKNIGTPCEPINLVNPTSDADSAPGSGFDMVPDRIRVTRFKVEARPPTPTNSGYFDISTYMAYGDDDLLKNLTEPSGKILCVGGDNNEFCGTTNISTSIARRLQ